MADANPQIPNVQKFMEQMEAPVVEAALDSQILLAVPLSR
jgi:hypothetical protein